MAASKSAVAHSFRFRNLTACASVAVGYEKAFRRRVMSVAEPNASKSVELLEKTGPHDHMCLIYEKWEEQFAVVVSAIRIGIERGEKVMNHSTREHP